MPGARQALARIDPQLAAYDVQSLNQFLDRSFVRPRFFAVVSTMFAAIALALAAIGPYGVLTYAVVSRRLEFGICMALGGHARTVLAGVMREGLVLTAAGVVAGLTGAFFASRALEALLFGIVAHDAATLAAASLVFVIVGAVACYVPARRAMRVDPIVALRCE